MTKHKCMPLHIVIYIFLAVSGHRSMSLQWLSLIGAIWLQAMSGTNSDFPAYSSELKHLLNLTQLQLNNLAFASDAGKLLGWISGVAATRLSLWIVVLVGGILGFVGYGTPYLFVTNKIHSLSYWHIFILTSLAGNSICWINTVSYIIVIQNFPLDRQIVVGLSTSYQGLSAKIFADIVNVINRSSPTKKASLFLLLNATLPLLVCLLVGPMIRNAKIATSKELANGFLIMFVITITTGVYAVISSFSAISRSWPPFVAITGMGILLIVLIMVPLVEKIREIIRQRRIRQPGQVYNVNIEDEVSNNFGWSLENSTSMEQGNRTPVYEITVREEIGPKIMLRRTEFWLYYFVYFFGVTLGLVYMNNLGQIVESRGSSRTSALVSLSSSFGFFGRLIPSLLDYYFARINYIVSRPASIAAIMIPMSGAFFLLVNGHILALYISTATIGICAGAITAISVATTTELFGAKNFGVNHNILVTNIPLGSFLFGDFAALIYKEERHGDSLGCIGTKCYQTTFLIWGSLCVFGIFLALVLHWKTKTFYTKNRPLL